MSDQELLDELKRITLDKYGAFLDAEYLLAAQNSITAIKHRSAARKCWEDAKNNYLAQIQRMTQKPSPI